MVMVEITPPSPDEIGGIWQGMSGSPVYAGDGRLIGAVAYGLSWGPSWVAGVTPFEDMDNYMSTPAAPSRVRVSDAAARSIARQTDVTRAQAAQGFSQLPMPTGVSGLTSKRLASIKRGHHQWLPKQTYSHGRRGGSRHRSRTRDHRGGWQPRRDALLRRRHAGWRRHRDLGLRRQGGGLRPPDGLPR